MWLMQRNMVLYSAIWNLIAILNMSLHCDLWSNIAFYKLILRPVIYIAQNDLLSLARKKIYIPTG